MKPKIHLTALSNDIFNANDLILGEWCIPDSNEKFLPYHWDEIDKMHSDFKVIDDIYEDVLTIFKDLLNEQHKKDYKLKSWRVLIGTWLHTTLHIIYDRYYIIDFFYKREFLKFNNTEICWYKIKSQDLVFFSSYCACDSLRRSDVLNQYIFQSILENFSKINSPRKKNIKNHNLKSFKKNFTNANFRKNKFMRIILSCASFLRRIFSSFRIYHVVTNYTRFPKIQDISLSLNFGSFYLPGIINDNIPGSGQIIFDYELRKNLTKKFFRRINKSKKLRKNLNTELINIIAKLIFELIPFNFLENFDSLHKKCLLEHWVLRKTNIFTANSFYNNDSFCMSSAIAINNNSNLFIIQHGGNFGNAKFNSTENHQRKISSKYLTWGWEEDGKTLPLGILKPIKKFDKKIQKKKEVLLISMELFRYSYVSYSGIHSTQWLDYQNDLERIAVDINSAGYDLEVRLKPLPDSWNSEKRWRSLNLKIDNTKSFFQSCRESKIVLCTYNAATFLETFYMDIPTIIYWDKKMWEMRPQANKFFEILKKLEILHYDKISLMKTLNFAKSIGYLEWWESKNKEKEFLEFKQNYCKEPNTKLLKYSSLLKI